MLIKRMLAKVLQNQEEIKKGLSKETAEKAGRYDEINEWLPKVGMSADFKAVKNIDGSTIIEVEYKMPKETVVIDPNGTVKCSERFKAINMCDLLLRSTQRKLAEAIDKAQEKKD